MTRDKQLRMDVYREGQIAYGAQTTCPYTDWRAGMWAKGYASAKQYYSDPIIDVVKPMLEDLEERIAKLAFGKCLQVSNGGLIINGGFTLDQLKLIVKTLEGET